MKDLTQGKEGKTILLFALPMLLGNLFQHLYSMIDSIIVGKFLGKEALAAVGASFPVIFIMIALLIGFSSGGMIVISQYFGAKDIKKVERTIETLYIFIFAASALLTVVGLLILEPIFRITGLPAELLSLAKIYLSIYISGIILFFGYNGTAAILRGLGDSKTPVFFLVIAAVMNIILDLLFVIVFKWGIAGAAIATLISHGGVFIAAMVYLHRTHPIISFNFRQWSFDREIFSHIFKIGLPTGLQQTFVAFGMIALFSFVNTFGTDVVAAYSAAGRIDSIAAAATMVFSQSLSTFVGQNLGAGKHDRVKRGLWMTLLMSWAVSGFLMMIIIGYRTQLMQLFTNVNEIEVIRVGSEYLIIVTSFYLIFTTMFTFNGLMRGAGDTLIPMFISLFSLWLVRIPLAFILSDKIGETGIWWSVPIGWLTGMILSYLYYRTGRWRKKMIIIPVIVE